MSALGHYLEQEGIASVSISLIREHSAALRPPRALWVPFMLGRPFGVPNDAAFQRDVLHAALRLLECAEGPVLEDFPRDAPYEDLGEIAEAQNCPISFPRPGTKGTLAEQLEDEISQLQAWHAVAAVRNGRTTLGVTGLSPRELAEFLLSWLGDSPRPAFREGLGTAGAIKLAADELRTFYYEAKGAQPGRRTAAEVQAWLWTETAAGRLFLGLRAMAGRSPNPSMKGLATLSLVPRAVLELLAARDVS